jgi:tripartite-type tricarboxylate transporter receptor subunit TctC
MAMLRRAFNSALALSVIGGLCAAQAFADDALNYPVKPVKIVVPYTPGSMIDSFGRLIAERLQSTLGQPFVVENRPGGSTLLGAKLVSGSDRDGYTLLVPTVTTLSIAPHIHAKMGVDPVRDFTPIARLGATNFFLVVRSSFPAKTMREWIDEVRRSPGKYLYGSSGVGTPHHIFMELLKKELGLDIGHVPYKGGNEIVPDLLSERVDMGFMDGFQAYTYVQSGKLRALGTTMGRQTTLIPNVPPIAETVPGFDWSGWVAFAGPPNMPKLIVDRIASEITKFQATPEYEAFLGKAIMEVTPALTPEQTAAFVRNEFNRWGPVIQSAGAISQ